eukprot:scpid53285/ scgid28993/ Bcl-2 homologous antagonist/killer; Apoptosis regulator BAK
MATSHWSRTNGHRLGAPGEDESTATQETAAADPLSSPHRAKEECTLTAERLIAGILSYNLEQAGSVDLPEGLRTRGEATAAEVTNSTANAAAGVQDASSSARQQPRLEREQLAAETVRPPPGSKGSNLYLLVLHLTKDVQRKYDGMFQNMMEELRPSAQTAYPQFLGVTEGMFREEITYGRILALIVFCSELALYCMEQASLGAEFITSVLAWFVRYYDAKLAQWMAEHNGWAGFEEAFSRFIPQIGVQDESGQIIPYDSVEGPRTKGVSWRVGMVAAVVGAVAINYFFVRLAGTGGGRKGVRVRGCVGAWVRGCVRAYVVLLLPVGFLSAITGLLVLRGDGMCFGW